MESDKEYWKRVNPPKKSFTHDELVNMGLRSKALSWLNGAVKNGTIKKSDCCQVCFRDVKLVGYHWNGYRAPFDVWWVCHKCNSNLKGELFHNGTISLEVTRLYIADKYKEKALINALYAAKKTMGGGALTAKSAVLGSLL